MNDYELSQARELVKEKDNEIAAGDKYAKEQYKAYDEKILSLESSNSALREALNRHKNSIVFLMDYAPSGHGIECNSQLAKFIERCDCGFAEVEEAFSVIAATPGEAIRHQSHGLGRIQEGAAPCLTE